MEVCAGVTEGEASKAGALPKVCAAICHSWQTTQGDWAYCIARGDEQMRRDVRQTSTLLLPICNSLLIAYMPRNPPRPPAPSGFNFAG